MRPPETVRVNGREFLLRLNLHTAAGHEHWVAIASPSDHPATPGNVGSFGGWSEASVREQALEWMRHWRP